MLACRVRKCLTAMSGMEARREGNAAGHSSCVATRYDVRLSGEEGAPAYGCEAVGSAAGERTTVDANANASGHTPHDSIVFSWRSAYGSVLR